MRLLNMFSLRRAAAAMGLLLSACSLLPTTVWESEAWNGRIEEAVFDAAADRVACRLADGRVVIREWSGGGAARAFSTGPYAVTAIAISGDGERVVWGDTSGRLHRWAPGAEPASVKLEDSALTGLAMDPVGMVAGAASSGTKAWFREVEGLEPEATRKLYLEQVRAFASDPTGTIFLAADHQGRLQRVAVDSSLSKTGSLSGIGARGATCADSADVTWLCWDEAGTLFFLDDSLDTLATLDLGNSPVTAHFYDSDNDRLLLGFRDGRLLTILLGARELVEEPLEIFNEPVVGLGGQPDGTLLAVTESGRILASQGNAFEPLCEPIFNGHLLRAHASLRAGVATVVTDSAPGLLSLADGSRRSDAEQAAGIVLDSAIFHGRQGSGPVELVLDPDTLAIQVEGDILSEPYPLDDYWTPTRIAAAAWSPQIALMSADGEIRVLDQTSTGLSEISQYGAEPPYLWGDLEFTANASGVRRLESADAASFRAPDGPFQMEVSGAGSVALNRIESDPVFLAWPDLLPATGGGMWSGYLGNIHAVSHPWIQQREFGWAYLVPSAETSWFWFAGEGWLAGSPANGPWLYAHEAENWLYTFVGQYPTDWVYDFSGSEWRRFGH